MAQRKSAYSQGYTPEKDEDSVICRYCDRSFDTEHSLACHHGHKHPDKTKPECHQTEKHKKAISEATKKTFEDGREVWNKGLTKENDERVKQMSKSKKEASKGRTLSEKTKEKISKSLKGRKMSEETKKKMSESFKGRTYSEESKRKMGPEKGEFGGEDNPFYGKSHSKEARRKMSENKQGKNHPFYGKKLSKEHIRKVLNSVMAEPNETEKRLEEIMRTNNIPYSFVGNGELIIDGLCPDFANNNGQKKLIELFGDYWHSDDEIPKREERFSQYGYKTLFVWEHALNEKKEKVIEKIKEFEDGKISSGGVVG